MSHSRKKSQASKKGSQKRFNNKKRQPQTPPRNRSNRAPDRSGFGRDLVPFFDSPASPPTNWDRSRKRVSYQNHHQNQNGYSYSNRNNHRDSQKSYYKRSSDYHRRDSGWSRRGRSHWREDNFRRRKVSPGRYAGPAWENSPDPKNIPIPKFVLKQEQQQKEREKQQQQEQRQQQERQQEQQRQQREQQEQRRRQEHQQQQHQQQKHQQQQQHQQPQRQQQQQLEEQQQIQQKQGQSQQHLEDGNRQRQSSQINKHTKPSPKHLPGNGSSKPKKSHALPASMSHFYNPELLKPGSFSKKPHKFQDRVPRMQSEQPSDPISGSRIPPPTSESRLSQSLAALTMSDATQPQLNPPSGDVRVEEITLPTITHSQSSSATATMHNNISTYQYQLGPEQQLVRPEASARSQQSAHLQPPARPQLSARPQLPARPQLSFRPQPLLTRSQQLAKPQSSIRPQSAPAIISTTQHSGAPHQMHQQTVYPQMPYEPFDGFLGSYPNTTSRVAVPPIQYSLQSIPPDPGQFFGTLRVVDKESGGNRRRTA